MFQNFLVKFLKKFSYKVGPTLSIKYVSKFDSSAILGLSKISFLLDPIILFFQQNKYLEDNK